MFMYILIFLMLPATIWWLRSFVRFFIKWIKSKPSIFPINNHFSVILYEGLSAFHINLLWLGFALTICTCICIGNCSVKSYRGLKFVTYIPNNRHKDFVYMIQLNLQYLYLSPGQIRILKERYWFAHSLQNACDIFVPQNMRF